MDQGKKMPLVSVVVLNYNGKNFLNDCLTSLQLQTYKSIKIIFIDNGSIDDSIKFVKNNFPGVFLLDNKTNLGFAEGNNKGIEIAKGDYIFVLNNDTVIENNCIEELIKVATKNKEIGMVAPKILSINDKKLIDSVGINIYPDGLGRGRGRNEKDNGQYDRVEEILAPSGCAALYKSEMLNEIGNFDKNFFAYCEDMDLGLRARLAGWKSFSAPRAIVYHHYSGTSGKFSEFKAFLTERNHFFVALKNFPISFLILLPFYTALRYFYNIFSIFNNKGPASKFSAPKSKLFFVLLKAHFSALFFLPKIIAKRRRIQKNKKITNKEFVGLLKKFRLLVWEITLKE